MSIGFLGNTLLVPGLGYFPDPPEVPTGLAITGASGGIVADLTPEATADAVADATGYDFEIALTATGLTGTPTVTNQPTPAYTFSILLNFTSYTVAVRARNAGGTSPWSAGVVVQTAYYLLRDLFSVDEAAPIATPANVDVGIRTVLADTGNDAAISGGKLSLTDAGASWTATVLQWAQAGDVGWTRAPGLCLFADVELGNAAAKFILGWDDTALVTYPRDGAIYFSGAGNGVAISSGESAPKILIPTTGVVYRLYIVLRDTGYLYFIKEGSGDPYLLWSTVGAFDPTGSATEATPKVKLATNSQTWTMDNLGVGQLPAPFDADWGLATLNVAAPVDGQDYTATADQELSLTLTAPGSITEEAGIIYRKLDADNYWRAYFDTAGAFKVDSVSAGTPTNRINVAGVIAGGATLTIRVLTNGSLHDAYTLAGAAPTKRGAQVNVSHQDTQTTVQPDIGAGWAAANLRSFPRTSDEYTILNVV